MVSIEDFQKLNIRICQIKRVTKIPESRKLLQIIFDTGSGERQVVAGMAPFFDDLQGLVGLKMPVLLNIRPATFAGYESQGMIVAADDAGRPVFLLPKGDIPVGSIVK